MKKVLLLLANGFEAVEASVFTDVIGWNKLDGDGTTDLITVGIREQLKCTFNFFDVAFKLLELLTSKENCDNVKKLMGF